MFEFHKKEKPLLSLSSFGGGAGGYAFGGVNPINLPFSATGGTKSGPTGGYYYHVFGSDETFTIISGISQVEVALTGGGGGGGGGGPSGGDEGGGGGGGAGTGIFTIGELIPGDYTVTVGGPGTLGSGGYAPGGAGGDSRFVGPPTYPGTLTGGGGGASEWYSGSTGGSASGSWPSSPTFTTNNTFSGSNGSPGDGRPTVATGPINGGAGGSAGHNGNPGWWSPFLDPGAGGTGFSATGGDYGGGGAGGQRGPFPGGRGGVGRVIVRYPDAV